MKIEDLRIGMEVWVINPEFSAEYPRPCIVTEIRSGYPQIARHPIENISLLDEGMEFDGFTANCLIPAYSTEQQANSQLAAENVSLLEQLENTVPREEVAEVLAAFDELSELGNWRDAYKRHYTAKALIDDFRKRFSL